jgi:hypothetical protein
LEEAEIRPGFLYRLKHKIGSLTKAMSTVFDQKVVKQLDFTSRKLQISSSGQKSSSKSDPASIWRPLQDTDNDVSYVRKWITSKTSHAHRDGQWPTPLLKIISKYEHDWRQDLINATEAGVDTSYWTRLHCYWSDTQACCPNWQIHPLYDVHLEPDEKASKRYRRFSYCHECGTFPEEDDKFCPRIPFSARAKEYRRLKRAYNKPHHRQPFPYPTKMMADPSVHYLRRASSRTLKTALEAINLASYTLRNPAVLRPICSTVRRTHANFSGLLATIMGICFIVIVGGLVIGFPLRSYSRKRRPFSFPSLISLCNCTLHPPLISSVQQ